MIRNLFSALVIGVLVVSLTGTVLAQERDPQFIDHRLGPPNFLPLGGGDLTCSDPNASFGGAPESVSDTISITGAGGSVSGLEVTLQIQHTWVGDIVAELEHEGSGESQVLIDRPGVPATACGCSGDDIDVVLSAGGTGSVENACDASVPSISGVLTPFPGDLGEYNGLDNDSDWTMTITDGFPTADDGTFLSWCINIVGTTPDGVPALTSWGVLAVIALFMSLSVFYIRRRVKASS